MNVTQHTIERVSASTNSSFETVLAKIRGGIGHPDMSKLWKDIENASSFQMIESIIEPVLGPTGLMQFGEFDDGGFIRKGTGDRTPKSMRLLVGNPLIMKQMTEHVPDAASYAPTTILIDEREGGTVHVSYDRMASFLSAYKNAKVMKIAKALDTKIETLIREAL